MGDLGGNWAGEESSKFGNGKGGLGQNWADGNRVGGKFGEIEMDLARLAKIGRNRGWWVMCKQGNNGAITMGMLRHTICQGRNKGHD